MKFICRLFLFSGIRNVPNVLTKNDEALKNGNIADKIMKDIDHLLSSLQIGEYDGNDDKSYNASVESICNWSENSFKCCQAFDLTGNSKFLNRNFLYTFPKLNTTAYFFLFFNDNSSPYHVDFLMLNQLAIFFHCFK